MKIWRSALLHRATIISMLLSIVSCCTGISDADDDADGENGADNMMSRSHGDAVVAEPCSDQRVIDSCQSVTVSAADTSASRQVHKPTVLPAVLPTCFFLQLKIHQSQPNIYTLFWRFDLITRSSSVSWWDRNVKIRYKCLVVIDEFLTVLLYQPNEFISRKNVSF